MIFRELDPTVRRLPADVLPAPAVCMHRRHLLAIVFVGFSLFDVPGVMGLKRDRGMPRF